MSGTTGAEEPGAQPDTGPERKGQRTRRRILEAARRCFGQLGYERATIRGIAAAAGVDKSSVIQYFESKQRLFREAVHFEIPIDELTTTDPAQTVENYLRTMLERWASESDTPMSVLLRASMTSDDAAALLRRHVAVNANDRIMSHLDSPDARLRAGLFSAIMVGIASGRYLLRIPDLADADLEEVLRVSVPVVQALIKPED
ncbi:TetR/AcrR family transcriptional regulator [Saccharopolyspora taberi]|uniref:TetR family transcriptional regulator n=1 Tax=Saccharopolyspora taberi TaxID=60895 RepID=A0ABN3VBN8_9PSEU